MAEEFQLGSGNWWETSRNRSYDSGTTPPASISTTLNAMASFGWPTEMVDMKPRESGTAALHGSSGGGGGLANPNLQVMGLGLSSQGMDWNQALLGEKAEGSFKSMLEEDSSSNSSNFQQQQWRQKQYFSVDNDFKQIDQPHFSSSESTITSQNLTTSFPVDAAAAAAAYGVLLSENHQHNASQPMSYPYSSSGGYGVLRQSPPPPLAFGSNTAHLHFTNNTPFWNAMTNARPSFPTASQAQIPLAPSFDEKPKITTEVQNLSTTTKKNSTETSNKRARNEASSPLPPFKVRKEKMGDRITALQQLVSPFGKTDTASVLSEAIEYIKFLHEQVSALSAPYMRNGAPIQHQQNSEKSKDQEGPRQDLRSRGLCLVPVSSTFPMTHETTVDFWTPTFGGSFR